MGPLPQFHVKVRRTGVHDNVAEALSHKIPASGADICYPHIGAGGLRGLCDAKTNRTSAQHKDVVAGGDLAPDERHGR